MQTPGKSTIIRVIRCRIETSKVRLHLQQNRAVPHQGEGAACTFPIRIPWSELRGGFMFVYLRVRVPRRFSSFAVGYLAITFSVTLATAQTPTLYYDFEGVTGTSVPNLGSAGSSFDGTLVTLDRTSVTNPITGAAYTTVLGPSISSDTVFGSGALQPTNLADSSAGAQDTGSLGGLMTVPQIDLGMTWSFSVWVKLTENPNQSPSNGYSVDNDRGKLQTLATSSDVFPVDGFKLFYNDFRFRENDPGAPRRLKLEGDSGPGGGGNASHTTPGSDVPDDGEYHHIAMTIDASGAVNSTHVVSEFYIDGVKAIKEPGRFDTIRLDNIDSDFYNQTLSIGAQNQLIEPFFAYGTLDEVKFFANTILTDEQVAELATIPGQAGDLDGDGDVDGSDFLQWQREDRSAPALAEWQTNYGNPESSFAATAVPEPDGFILLLAAIAPLALRHRLPPRDANVSSE